MRRIIVYLCLLIALAILFSVVIFQQTHREPTNKGMVEGTEPTQESPEPIQEDTEPTQKEPEIIRETHTENTTVIRERETERTPEDPEPEPEPEVEIDLPLDSVEGLVKSIIN